MRALLGLILVIPGVASAAVTTEQQQVIRQSTFEVVMKKPEKDQVTYEKPLPLELMPYIERTDAYRSMGTAFALGHNLYVTAGHVIVAGVNSQFGPPVLRRPDGSIFEIDRILKYSADEDFVVFSLKNDPNPKGLEPERSPRLDQQVLAVGNALGEGIVIRDGLFTSETPEQQDGRWKWIRFSAAASPGNSGGPLCDADGHVIGIVIGKSENENLNYSLPIGRVLDASASHATFDERRLAAVPLVHGTVTYSFKDEFSLPQTWSAFSQAYLKVADRHFDESRARVLSSNAASLFPKGDGSLDVLYRPNRTSPRARLISEAPDGNWSSGTPEYHSVDLTQDGAIAIGDYAGVRLIHLTRPAHASDDGFYSDSKNFMDLALKGLDIRRPVGPDKVRVTSLGAAASTSTYTDEFGRKWQERVWPVPFFDAYLQAELLPTPDGYDGIIIFAPSVSRHDARLTGQWFADHVDTGYTGTLAQWQAMLNRKELLPHDLDGVKLVRRDGWTLETPRVNSSIPPDVLALDERSLLSLDLAFADEKPKVSLVISEIRWEVDERRAVGATVWRSVRPPAAAKLELRNRFESVAARHVPYDGSVNRDSAETFSMTRVVDVPGKSSSTVAADLKYAVTLSFDHYQSSSQMETRFSALEHATKVLERSAGGEVAALPRPIPGDAALTADVDATQDAIDARLKEMQKAVGRDIRGREPSDDFRDCVQAPAARWAGKAPDDAQQRDMQRRGEWLNSYWSVYPALTRNRDMWDAFLQKNHLSEAKHGAKVLDLQAALLVSLSAGCASEHSGERARELLHALVEERKAMMRSIVVPSDLSLAARVSPCTAPVSKVSITNTPAYFSSTSSLEQMWPVESKRLGEEGAVLVRVTISPQGCVKKLAIAGYSGSDTLDSTVLRYAETMSFKPGGDDDGKPIETTVTIPIVFVLTNAK